MWYEAIDFSNPSQGGQATTGIYFVVEGSTDGGNTWVELDKIEGDNPAWQLRDVPLDGKLPLDGHLMLRFTAQSPSEDQLVEAGLDSVSIIHQTVGCDPSASTAGPSTTDQQFAAGCAVSPRATPTGALFLAALIAAALLRRRALR